MSSPRHYLQGDVRWPLTVTVVGCGGNGAQMLSGLAAIEIALKELGDRSISVEVYDNDGHHICTGLINWQIKAWKNVKLKA